LRYLGTSEQKARLVINAIRGKGVGEAISTLHYLKKGIARDLERLLKSAVANAEQREQRVDVDRLYVSRAYVDRAPMAKRLRHRAMGRVFRILKRSCHVTLELDLRSQG
jgi:large subunit ribosomal protein L22